MGRTGIEGQLLSGHGNEKMNEELTLAELLEADELPEEVVWVELRGRKRRRRQSEESRCLNA